MIGTIFYRCGKRLGGLTHLQEKIPPVMLDKGSKTILAISQLKIITQEAHRERVGRCVEQLQYGKEKDHWRKSVMESVVYPDDLAGPKFLDDGCAD